MKIALDGMGGDSAPGVIVEGAVEAVNEFGYDIILVGQESILKKELAKYTYDAGKIVIEHAPQVVDMGDSPVASIRAKKNSSVSVAVNLVKEKKANALVSAGNTGATVCAASFNLGLLKGIERPGISIVFPTSNKGNALMIDAGANIDTKPIHLFQYGLMADAYCKFILGKQNPRVGLLSIGEEKTKGTGFVKEGHKLLDDSKINFIGNIEGRDIFTGGCDIILCDGFVGNVVLKVAESLAGAVSTLLKRELSRNLFTIWGALLCRSTFEALKKELDYAEYGGAPLLGINGTCIISHGSSSARAIKNALKVADKFTRQDVNKHIIDGLGQYSGREMHGKKEER
ncbi:MAG: phosphate acyltransferase PlsX [Candidatus Omnitrophica bacterium]|nr:phosphate acyltransferase PlsX [Candidatus Omnitrophota bacterium]